MITIYLDQENEDVIKHANNPHFMSFVRDTINSYLDDYLDQIVIDYDELYPDGDDE